MKIKKILPLILLIAGIGTFYTLSSGSKKYPKKPTNITVAFYNLENLFDVVDDPNINDEEFLPGGSYGWNQSHLDIKLHNLAKVISQLGDEDGPEILGVCEVENLEVLEMLVAQPALKKHKYKIMHHDSPDQRGIDCALLYKEKVFQPLYQRDYRVDFPENTDIKTRDIFMVKGILEKSQEVTFFVNHWPSRRGGSKDSEWKRVRAAETLRHVVDSIFEMDKYARMVIMGDFNDEPSDTSIAKVLKATFVPGAAAGTGLYNAMTPIFLKGEQGSLMYNKQWDLFDQMIVSRYLSDSTSAIRFIPNSQGIYNPQWMQVAEGDWKGAPRRSHIRRKFYEDGFSDHFPVYIQLSFEP